MADLQQSLQRCAQARQFIKSAKAMKGSKSLVLKAIELYEQVIQDNGQELAEPYFGLGYLAYAGGRPELAIQFLQSGLVLAPDHQRMRQLILRARKASEQQKQRAAEQAETAVETPTEPEGPPPNTLVSDLGPEGSGKPCRGAEVVMLQQALIKMGHSLMVSGLYDRPTYAAVRAVQSLYKLPVTGQLDAATREQLNPIVRVVMAERVAMEQLLGVCQQLAEQLGTELNEFQKQMGSELLDLLLNLVQDFPEESEEPLKSDDTPFPSRLPIQSRLGNMGQMGIVSKGPEVERAQQVLALQGFPVKATGQFDLQTFSELSRFQLQHKLPVSGIVEGPTRDLINQFLEPIFHQEAAQEAIFHILRQFQSELQLQLWPTIETRRTALTDVLLHVLLHATLPEIPLAIADYFRLISELGPANRPGKVSQGREVRLLQQLLKVIGYDKVAINGVYDNDTYAAVRSFQISKKLPMNGMVDAKTREELNALMLHALSQPTKG